VILESIASEFARYKALAESAIAQVDDDALVKPAPGGGNSIAVICWHIAGNLRSRFTDFLTTDGEKPWRQRDEEFVARRVSREELLEKWEQGWRTLSGTLAMLDDRHLEEVVLIRGQQVRVVEALHRSLAHASSHVGQIVFLARQLTGEAWTTLSIPVGKSEEFNRRVAAAALPVNRDQAARVARFRELHAAGCFVIPNPWDAGGARLLEQLGFQALASTSSGFAWSLGRPDNHVTLADAIAHLRRLAATVQLPVNADFEGGFATAPDAVAANVRAAVRTGIAGLSIEDSTRDPGAPLVPFDLAVARIAAARRAIDDSDTGVLLTARSEGFIVGRPDLDETHRRLTAFADAGADCLFAPGLRTAEEIGAIVRAVAPRPVNVLVSSRTMTVAQIAALGVRRISVGGALARMSWAAFLDAATEIATHGTFTALGRAVPFADVNARFSNDLPERGRR
jgi:2-methylisocitrate lyase-like PEP mutase family enzyme